MSLSAGTRLGPYEILAPLGAGGMGEVYRARDARLNRDVALKVLPDAFSKDTERMARFGREAQVLASLNHPNIAALYGLEEANGVRALVMELVEGPTLAERIANRPDGRAGSGLIPIDEALPIAKQIAEALEYAHEKGVIHRDLKPANVKITREGTVKLLDFGLAKALEEDPTSSDPQNSPTISMAATRAGVILGTAGYMSPEQARGKPVDRRADIWSFGAVLYEMLTGRQLYAGESVAETLASVMKDEPKWDALPADTPKMISKLLRRCLDRDPKRRLRDIGEARIAIEEEVAAPSRNREGAVLDSPHLPAVTPPGRLLHWPVIAACATFLALAGGAVSFIHFRESAPVAEPVRFQIPLPAGSGQFGLSPDGRWLAFVVQSAEGGTLWLRRLDSLESRPVPGAAGIDRTFFWSPDSRFIAFGAGGKLKKISISGGLPQTICDIERTNGGVGGSWNRDGVIIFGGEPSGIMRVSAAGGVATPVTAAAVPRTPEFHAFPSFLPDGRHFVYLRVPTDPGVFLGSLDAKPEQQSLKRVLATLFSPVYAPSPDPARGYLLLLHEGTLMAQRFDARRLELSGEPVPIAEGLGKFLLYGFFSASANGVLAYRNGAPFMLSRPTWFDRQGKALGPAAEAGNYASLALAPDGTRVAAVRLETTGESVGQDIWLVEFARGANTRFTFGPVPAGAPVWSPDGTRIAFQVLDGLYVKRASGVGKEELLFKPSTPSFLDDWSRDGRFLLYSAIDPKTGYDLWVLPEPAGTPGDRKPTPFLQTQFNERQGRFSPDSHWIAYVSDESGRPEVYVRPFPASPNGGEVVKVSQDGGGQPRWRRDGKELFYLSRDGKLMAVDVAGAGAELKAGIPKPLFQAPTFAPVGGTIPNAFRWDVTADGKRFLISTAAEAPVEPVTVVLNWQAGLEK